jgi:two-component system, NarL family, capsular synthesis sensor histidine kinase RcsC
MAQPLAMVVDDSPIVLKFATTIVEKLGYRVCTASDGLQALALLKDARCKLVLTDYEMPTINGYQLAKKVKSQLLSIRVVIMTGLCQNQVIELMNDQDIDGWLFKPFGLEELKAILWQLGLYDNTGPADSVQLRSPKSNGLNQRKQKMTSITGSD